MKGRPLSRGCSGLDHVLGPFCRARDTFAAGSPAVLLLPGSVRSCRGEGRANLAGAGGAHGASGLCTWLALQRARAAKRRAATGASCVAGSVRGGFRVQRLRGAFPRAVSGAAGSGGALPGALSAFPGWSAQPRPARRLLPSRSRTFAFAFPEASPALAEDQTPPGLPPAAAER